MWPLCILIDLAECMEGHFITKNGCRHVSFVTCKIFRKCMQKMEQKSLSLSLRFKALQSVDLLMQNHLHVKEPSRVPHSCYYLLAYPACLSWTNNLPWIIFGSYLLMEFLGGESFPDFIWYCLYMVVTDYIVLYHKEHSHSVELLLNSLYPPPPVSCQRRKCSFSFKLGICSCHMEFDWLRLIN
jgi:hypothetical protein